MTYSNEPLKNKNIMKTKNAPLDLFQDLTILIEQFAEMYNCNHTELADNGIDWQYLHKVSRRANYFLEHYNDTEE